MLGECRPAINDAVLCDILPNLYFVVSSFSEKAKQIRNHLSSSDMFSFPDNTHYAAYMADKLFSGNKTLC